MIAQKSRKNIFAIETENAQITVKKVVRAVETKDPRRKIQPIALKKVVAVRSQLIELKKLNNRNENLSASSIESVSVIHKTKWLRTVLKRIVVLRDLNKDLKKDLVQSFNAQSAQKIS